MQQSADPVRTARRFVSTTDEFGLQSDSARTRGGGPVATQLVRFPLDSR